MTPIRAASFAAVLLPVFAAGTAVAETTRPLPPPTQTIAPAESGGLKKIVLAGGCFWGVQGVYQHVKGVTSAVSGYAGGPASAANYTAVSTGRTGHAEAVEVTYDPSVVSAAKLLQIFFSVAHDPTELDRQGPDTGPQYRSEIFATDDAQAALAKAYVAQLDVAKSFTSPIVTKIEPLPAFYPAEAYHQDYLILHPYQPYIFINDQPKVDALKRLFPDLYRAEPKRVAGS